MRIREILFKCMLITGVALAFFVVSNNYTSVVYTAEGELTDATAPTWVDRIFAQMDGVFSLTAQTIQAVLDIDEDTFRGESEEATTTSNQTVPEISDSFIPKLFDPRAGSLLVNVPFTLTRGLTVQGESTLASTTIAGVFVATGSTELNSLVVGGDSRMQRLRVLGSANLGTLEVQGQSTLGALRIGGVAEILGALSAVGGITTNGATIDLEGGNLYAANVINELVAGDNITISGTPNAPIISARRSSVSTPNLETVRARGGCVECITDSDVDPQLTIVGGSISSTTIGFGGASSAVFTNVTIGTTSATTTLEVNGAFDLNGLLTVLGTGTSTFDGGINVTGGCVAVNGNCLGAGATYLDDLLDVDVATAANGELLMFDGSDWVSVATSSLAIGAENLSELDDVLVTGPSAGELLSFDGTDWINVATSTLGLGDGTFLGLRDTPNSFLANAISFANATSSALTQVADFVFDGNRLGIGTSSPIDTLSVAGTAGILGRQALRFYNTANTNYVGFRASSSLASNVLWSLPVSDGGVDEILVTDGAGNLRFANVSSVGGGSDTFLGLDDTVDAFINKSIPYVSANTLTFSTGLSYDGSRLGIGNSNPTAELTVQGSVRFQQGTTSVGFAYNTTNNRVGIGTVSPTEKFVVEGGSILQRGAATSTTYTPTIKGELNLPSNVNDVQIIGLFAYVVTNAAGNDFHIIDISNPSSPVEVGSLNLSDSALGVYIAGKYAYVVTNATGNDFHVIDISNPALPVELGSISLSSGGTDVFVLGQYAYVTTDGAGDDFHIIDITDTSLPRHVGSLAMTAAAYTVTVVGAYAYVGGESTGNGFYVLDVSNPQSPTQAGTINLSASVNDIFIQGRYAYLAVAGASNHFRIIDISTPSLPVVTSTLTLDATANGVFVAGRYAYVASIDSANEFDVIDISSASLPIRVGSLDLGSGSGLSVAVYGRYAYVTTASVGNDFHIVDITGVEAQSAFVHSLESGTFSTLGDATISGLMTISDGLRVGVSGIQTDGSLFVQGSDASFIANNIGIGTTSAPRTLTVGGDIQIEGALYDSFVSAGLSGYVLQSTATGIRWQATSTLGFASNFTSSAQLAAMLSDETGTGDVVLSDAPTLTGTLSAEAATLSSILTFTGTTANIALGSNFLSGDGQDEGVYVTGGGDVGIGTTTPNTKLAVQGTIMATNLQGGATNLTTDAQGNIIRDPSDERLKTDIATIDGALEKMLSLRGVSYRWIDTERFGEQTEIGFIAQEVDEVLPEVVRKGGDYWSLNTRNILAVVIEGFKEMWTVVQGNQEKIELLEDRIEQLESEMYHIEDSETQGGRDQQVDTGGDNAEDSVDGGIENPANNEEILDDIRDTTEALESETREEVQDEVITVEEDQEEAVESEITAPESTQPEESPAL